MLPQSNLPCAAGWVLEARSTLPAHNMQKQQTKNQPPLPLQVHGAGTGIRRHRLFYLGFKLTEREAAEGGARRWGLAAWLRSRRAARDAAAQQRQQQGGREKGGVELAAAPAGSAVHLEAPAADDEWMAGYYGSAGPQEAAEQLRSPQLPPRPSGAAAAAPPPLLRKPTSVRLAVPAEPAAGGSGTASSACSTNGAASCTEEAEGVDVAAERARVEALWLEWWAGSKQRSCCCLRTLHMCRCAYMFCEGNQT
jgi:hypothetical protein